MAKTMAGVTGDDLKLLRQSRRITATALARRLGVSRQAVSNLEAAGHPTPRAIERYLAALNDVAAAEVADAR
jgi:transcriptional regulator with XRE-family HTH domain